MTDDQRSDLVEAGAIAAYSHPDGWPFQVANRETKDYFRAMSARMLTAVIPLIETQVRLEVQAGLLVAEHQVPVPSVLGEFVCGAGYHLSGCDCITI